MSSLSDKRVVAVCGLKDSGKTTLITKLVQTLTARGLRVAVIKHDGHDFVCDVSGTDSARYMEAGAYGSAIFSADHVAVQRRGIPTTSQALIALFPEADVILIEGLKASTLPKIEIVRAGISETPVSNPEGRFLIVSDLPASHFDEPVLPFQSIDAICARIIGRSRSDTDGCM